MLGDRVRADLATALDGCAAVGDVRGLGLMIGIELVRDAGTKEPFPGPERVTERVLSAARDAGLLLLLEHRPRRRHQRRPDHARTALRPHRRRGRDARRADRRRDPVRRVSGSVALIVEPEAGRYDHGPQHPAPSGTGAAHLGADAGVRARRRAGRRTSWGRSRPTTRRSASSTRRRSSTRRGAPAMARKATGGASATAPATTRSSRTCTRPPRSCAAPRWRPPGRSSAAARRTRSTPPAACTTRCPTGPPASASTTIPPSAIAWMLGQGRWSGWRTSTWTSITATASRRCSSTIRASSPSRSTSTRPRSASSPGPASASERGRAPARARR